jgi:HD superfamily phosphodiesterase
MNRLEHLRQMVDAIIPTQPDAEQRRCGYVHLYGVAQACALLALKRGLDLETCLAAGMLHDIWNYGPEFTAPHPDHATLGLPTARRILHESGFSPAENEAICTAISHHSDKAATHGPLDELLKDADVLQHYLCNPAQELHSHHNHRLAKILDELGLSDAM